MLRSKVKKAGKPTQKSDSLIASIALANHMILVTRNTKHFAPIQGVSELQVENWFE
jgi:tRNA(fMet)-specific endonuclease VapC